MPLLYIHLSDIHFGQEKGGQIIVNDDVKEQLISDVQRLIPTFESKAANGIIISGDIAYAGTKTEYERAGAWLDRLTAAAGCQRTAVQVVPGNHDIDLSKISNAGQLIIDDIAKHGDQALNKYLDNEVDREILYQKFTAYRVFAEAYDCPLDSDGNVLNHRLIEISTNKWLKFYGVNTALLCSKSRDEEGKLLLGQRQRVIPNNNNVEVIVIAHHPLNWLQDSEDISRFLKNRARILISGHEHKPSHKIEEVEDGCCLLSIASGAAMPPKTSEEYTYCYNILEFSWNEEEEKLLVKIHPRRWEDKQKKFTEDTTNFEPNKCIFSLKCPNFESIRSEDRKVQNSTITVANQVWEGAENTLIQAKEIMSDNEDQILLLKFFRDLSSTQRLATLVSLEALPSDLTEPITHTIETKAVRSLLSAGKAEQLKQTINQILSTKIDKKDD